MRTKAPRTANINKQNMFYSLYKGESPVYEKDSDGFVIYDEIDGESVPREAGFKAAQYSMPVPFKANINSELNEMRMKAWGIDQSSIYAEIVCQKNYIPLEVGSIIWRTSPVEYDEPEQAHLVDSENNYIVQEDGEYIVVIDGEPLVHRASADYTVVGIRTEGLTEDWYLLQRNSSDSEGNNGN